MKNYKLMIVSLLFGSLVQAQVGVGTATPSAGLDVVSKGNTNATKALEINNSDNTEMVTVLNNGNVGIGNTAPTRKLDINNGTTPGAIKIVDGTQGDGKVLTSDANGVATWSATPATALYFISTPVVFATDFSGTVNPVSGAPAINGTYDRFLVNASAGVRSFGPPTTYTFGSGGLSYTIPQNGLYRITLYSDTGYVGARIGMAAYRGGNTAKINLDNMGAGIAATMINLWDLRAGDVVVPVSISNPVPNGQIVETTFTVERVN